MVRCSDIIFLSSGPVQKVFRPPGASDARAQGPGFVDMDRIRPSPAVVLALLAALSLLVPANASASSEGDRWVYSAEVEVEGILASGTLIYEAEGRTSIAVGALSHEVDLFKVTGSVSGAEGGDSVTGRSVDAVFDGLVYELGYGTVREEMYTWVNETVWVDSLSTVTRTEAWDVATYSVPVLGGFDGTTMGAEWNATPVVTTTSTVWVDDTLVLTSSDEGVEAYSCSVSDQTVTVSTGAGDFICLEVTVVDEDGYRKVFLHSPEAERFVKVSFFAPDGLVPYMDLDLLERSLSSSWGTVIIVVGLLAVVAVAAVTVVLVMRRRGRGPVG